MAPFDRPYTTFYWSAIVTIALSGTVFELFDVEQYRDLEIWVRGHSRSMKLVPFESLGAVSYSPSIVTMALSCISSEIKPDIGRKSSYPPCIRRPRQGVPVGILTSRLVRENQNGGAIDGEKDLRIRVTIYTQHQCVLDGQTDRDILPRHSPFYIGFYRETRMHRHTRRAVKTNVETLLGLMLNEKSARFRWKH